MERDPKRRQQVRNRQLAAIAAVLVMALVGIGAAIAATTHTHTVKVVQVIGASTSATRAKPGSAPFTLPPGKGTGGASAGSSGTTPATAPAATTTPAATPTQPAPARAPALLSPSAVQSFAALRSSLPGPVELSLRPLGQGSAVTLGGDRPAHAWSTSKVPVLASLLLAKGAAGLNATEMSEAERAITESDNDSILALFSDLEQIEGGLTGASNYITQLLRKSGDDRTTVATAPPPPGGVTTFGQTEWAPSQATKFFRALAGGCLIPRSRSNYLLGLMQHIESSESWGLGSGGFIVPVAFKGGWGPESGGSYLVRQAGIIDPGTSKGVVVAIVAFPPAGSDSFEQGTEMLTRTSQWLKQHLRLQARAATGC